jgi:hypothetical protein
MVEKSATKKPKTKSLIKNNSDIFDSILASFVFGLLRLNNTRIIFNASTLAIINFHTAKAIDISENPYKNSLQYLKDISPHEVDSYQYISFISYLIYSTSLFDTFLSDCTKFLLLLHPNSIGKGQSIPVEALLNASSRAELINQAVIKKVREISYLPFIGRIDFLRSTFGLRIDLDDETQKNLAHYSGLRNIAVHDQGLFEIQITNKNQVQAFSKSDTPHPTPVSRDDVRKAIRAYGFTVLKISNTIMKAFGN